MKYVIDIDGTICENTDGNYEKAVPKPDRILKINKLYNDGNYIVYLTARGMGRYKNSRILSYRKFYSITYNQLRLWGCKFHELHMGKPSGDVYIDDKGIRDNEFFGD